MVIKILKSSPSFEGVNYNERKNAEGKSELLAADNFDAIKINDQELRRSDYLNYLQKVSSLNDRVKNKQFHAILSCKGKEYSPEQLKDFAKQYLREMGYSENPYLIYFHSDTPHNHVHIVSTRVDKNGQKVNDQFEKLRSQTFIQKLNLSNPMEKAKNDLKDSLKYNCSTPHQLAMVLEQRGYSTKISTEGIDVIKGGRVQVKINSSYLNEKLSSNVVNEKRVNQLKAIFKKYKPGMNTDEFTKFIKQKFGIDFIFHSKNGSKPYGYSLIDHSGKNVFKGSSIMKLSEVLEEANLQDKIKEAKNVFEDTFNRVGERSTFSQMKNLLSSFGYELSSYGNVSVKGNKLFKIPPDQLKRLKYNQRLFEAKQVHPKSEIEQNILCKIYYLKKDDLPVNDSFNYSEEEYQFDKRYYSNIMACLIKDPYSVEEKDNLLIVSMADKEFLLDKKYFKMFSMEELNIEIKDQINMGLDTLFIESFSREEIEEISEKWDPGNGNILSDLAYSLVGKYNTEKEETKKRRNIKR